MKNNLTSTTNNDEKKEEKNMTFKEYIEFYLLFFLYFFGVPLIGSIFWFIYWL